MKRFVGLLICFVACCGLAVAQTAGNDAAAREKRRADKRLVVQANLALSDAEAKVFWPVYDAYQSRLSAINDRTVSLIERYAAAYRAQSVDDALAGNMVKEFGQINDDEYKASVALITEVSKVLPPIKAVRYLQIENKIRASEKSYIADAVPVVPPQSPR